MTPDRVSSPSACRQCATILPPSFPSAKRQFCSYACCAAWRRANGFPKSGRTLAGTPSFVSKPCAHCGAAFSLRACDVGRRKFCSHHCYSKRSRKRLLSVVRCPQCGKVREVPRSVIPKGRGRFCSRRCAGIAGLWKNGKISQPEQEFCDSLEACGVIVERQRRFGRYTIDAFVREWNLAIEIDGVYWHALPKMVARDRRKDAYLAGRGIKIERITIGRRLPAFDELAANITRLNRGGVVA